MYIIMYQIMYQNYPLALKTSYTRNVLIEYNQINSYAWKIQMLYNYEKKI